MPSRKRSRGAGPSATTTAGAKKQSGHRRHPRPPKPPPDQFGAEPPIVITSGSVQIEFDDSIFPTDPGNKNKHKNANRKLTTLTIQDLSSPPNTLMTVDLKSLANSKCKIVVSYDR